jgi:hypothetical protein
MTLTQSRDEARALLQGVGFQMQPDTLVKPIELEMWGFRRNLDGLRDVFVCPCQDGWYCTSHRFAASGEAFTNLFGAGSTPFSAVVDFLANYGVAQSVGKHQQKGK